MRSDGCVRACNLYMTNWISDAVVPGVITVAHPIDYAQALGLLLLSRILFGGFRGRPGFRRAGRWSQWQAMTPEERTRMRESAGSRGCR